MKFDRHYAEVFTGLIIEEALNEHFGEGSAKLIGNGNTEPRRVEIKCELDGCCPLKAIVEKFNIRCMIDWIRS